MSVDHPLKDKAQYSFPSGSGSRSPLFAPLVNPRQLRIAIALLGRQINGVGCFPQSLSMRGLEVAVRGCQLCEPTSRVKRNRCDLATILVPRLLPVQCQHLSRSNQPWNPFRFRRSSFGSRAVGAGKMYPSGRVRCLDKVSTSSSATQVKLRRRADHGCTWW